MNKVLLIEDNAPTISLIQAYLLNEPYELAVADNGRSGVDRCKKEGFDIVITDIFMPIQDGLETIKVLRSQFPQTRIIAISGGVESGNIDFLREAKTLGATATLIKPIRKDTLIRTLNEVMENTQNIAGKSSPSQKQKVVLYIHKLKTSQKLIAYYFNNMGPLSHYELICCSLPPDLPRILEASRPFLILAEDTIYLNQAARSIYEYYNASKMPKPKIIICTPSSNPVAAFSFQDEVPNGLLKMPLQADALEKAVTEVTG